MAKHKNKPPVFTGLSLEQWHADSDNLRWAQTEARFRSVLSVVLNESRRTLDATGCSGERGFGRVEGYHIALQVLESLAMRPPKEQPMVPADFRGTPEEAYIESPTRD